MVRDAAERFPLGGRAERDTRLEAGDVLDGIIDIINYVPAPRSLELEPEKINRLLGTDISKEQMVDYLTLVLRNPTYVGKDIFGRDRIDKIMVGLGDYDRRFSDAYTVKKEADVAQEHLDDALREVYGDDLVVYRIRVCR